jgi:hypothetical protein
MTAGMFCRPPAGGSLRPELGDTSPWPSAISFRSRPICDHFLSLRFQHQMLLHACLLSVDQRNGIASLAARLIRMSNKVSRAEDEIKW